MDAPHGYRPLSIHRILRGDHERYRSGSLLALLGPQLWASARVFELGNVALLIAAYRAGSETQGNHMDSVLPPKEETMASVREAFGLAESDTGSPEVQIALLTACLLYTSPSPRDQRGSRMPSSA